MIRYSVRVDDAAAHYAAFRVSIPRRGSDAIDLVLPAWVPGSYWIQDPAKHLVDLMARRTEGHASVPVTRIDKGRWRIGGEGAVEVSYRAYGRTATTEGLDVDDDHLFFTGIFCLPYVDGRKADPCELSIEARPGHEVVTDLDRVGEHPATYHAPTYDELADAVVDVGTPTVVTCRPNGIPHRICLCGRGGNFEPNRYAEDIGRVVEAAIRFMGDSPVRGYTFYQHLGEAYDGGLEHLRSNSCVLPRFWFRPASSYQRLLFLASHEYFHLYNVKRIHPEVLGPFDYTQEVYTKQLWLMEGTTDYIGHHLLRTAGLISPSKYLEAVAKDAQRLLETPGRHHRSLEEASQLAWIDLYRSYEETPNRSVSYYVKGHLVSLALDLLWRERSDGTRSWQDVMRLLWNEFGKVGKGIPEGAFPALAERATGQSIDDFVAKYIAGTEELDLDAVVRPFGLKFEAAPRSAEPDDDGDPGYLGADAKVRDGFLRVNVVRDGTPARAAGLSPGDEIVAVDNAKVVPTEFEELLKRFPPGTAAELTVFRKGWLTKVPVTFGRPPPTKYRFVALPEASPKQRQLYENWLGAPWVPGKAKEPTAS